MDVPAAMACCASRVPANSVTRVRVIAHAQNRTRALPRICAVGSGP